MDRDYLGVAAWATPLAVLLALGVYLPLRRRQNLRQKRKGLARELWLCVLVAYLAVAAVLVFSPGGQNLANPFALAAVRVQTGQGINLTPFYTLRQVWQGKETGDILNLAGNVLLFVPFGFLLPHLFVRWAEWYETLPLALGVSAGIEAVQLFLGRSVDIDDVLLNSLGALLGYVVFRIVQHVQRPTQFILKI